ncbi:MAG: acyltransferase 3 [Acidimicrobiales bacterium]|nr:acyltransferase 3 [Acidimicrobiales bacterium]
MATHRRAAPGRGGFASDTGDHLPQLDGLRAILIGLVVIHHLSYLGPASWVPRGGWLGVDGFLVVSGFLVTTAVVDEVDRTGRLERARFVERRLRRRYPTLVVVVLVGALLAVTLEGESVIRTAESLAVSAALITNLSVGFGDVVVPALFPIWAVALELQFCVLLALALAGLRKLRAARWMWVSAIGAAMVGSALLRATLWHGPGSYPGPYVLPWTRLDTPGWGALAALAIHWGWLDPDRRRWVRPAALVAGPAATLAIAWEVGRRSPTDAWIAHGGLALFGAVLAVAIAALVLRPESLVARLLSAAPFVAVGRRSAGIYLWHLPLFIATASVLPDGSPARWVLALAATGVCAELTHQFLERPLRGSDDASATPWGRGRTNRDAASRTPRSPNRPGARRRRTPPLAPARGGGAR